jgi:hypothetical protein
LTKDKPIDNMVRGNWQKRVETAENRRQEGKQRKQRTQDKRLNKIMVVDMLGLLDRHRDSLRRIKGRDGSHRRILHIWTDTLAADSPPDLLLNNEGPATGKARKPRSISVESEGSARKGPKKKVHPRSHQGETQEASHSDDLVLCKPHFFAGKCRQHGHKGGGCRHMHYTIPQMKTLHAICSGGKNDKTDSAHGQASQAVPLE